MLLRQSRKPAVTLNSPDQVEGNGCNVELHKFKQVVDFITGDTGTTAAITTTDPIPYHAGMVQAQTVAEGLTSNAAGLLFSSGEPDLACPRWARLSNQDHMLTNAATSVYYEDKPGFDHYNLCHSCYGNGSRCRLPSQHTLHIRVEEFVWKPPGLEVLGSGNGIPHTTCNPLTGVLHMTIIPRNVDKVINLESFLQDPTYAKLTLAGSLAL
ncbi:hypothetical protein FHL15_005552 [Xylaria flabelliformis]|uniref:Uncharacterized protein n=1 Tax=Xylaria flabelliformis TaxID=2512241 RepID=A0A553I045_9PEZI|nr:hypothetical protein FHL15_005552 [Xylaria flabelliformis]